MPFNAAVHVVAHIGQIYHSRLIFDHSYPKIDHSVLESFGWEHCLNLGEVGIYFWKK